uniref:C-type lectin domain-containing protein n=1 Tax=Paramormyrops kingsleyae TaxID=1676925 RepID=A0A3B3T0X6_9TELE
MAHAVMVCFLHSYVFLIICSVQCSGTCCPHKLTNGVINYTLIQQPKSWTDAVTYCQTYYTDLVYINSSSQNDEVINFAQGVSYFWIGLSNNPWTWVDGGTYSFTLALHVLQIASFVLSSLTVQKFHANYMLACGCEHAYGCKAIACTTVCMSCDAYLTD